MFIWLIKIVTTGKCVRGGVFMWLAVIRTLKYPATVCQPSPFAWLLFLFFPNRRNRCGLHFCSRVYFSHICHHEDKPPNDAGINSPLWWHCRVLPIAEGIGGPAVETISNHRDAKLEWNISSVLCCFTAPHPFHTGSFIKCQIQGCNTTSSVITVIEAPHVKPDVCVAGERGDSGFIYFQHVGIRPSGCWRPVSGRVKCDRAVL